LSLPDLSTDARLQDAPGTTGEGPPILEFLQRLMEGAVGSGEVGGRVVYSLLIILLIWTLRRLVVRVVEGRVDDPRSRYQWAKASGYTAFLVAVLLVGQIWLQGLRTLGTFLGLLSAGLAIALKDVVADVAGWLFIISRRPFEVGDRVQIGPHAGDVVGIRVFQFTVLEIGNWVDADQSTGRVIHVPNALIFTQPLANYTADFEYLWNEIPVTITFESDWRRAREILEEVAEDRLLPYCQEAEASLRKVTRKFFIQYAKVTPVVYTSVKPNGVVLTLRYLCPPRERRGTSQEVWERVLDAFRGEPAIQFAYPTQRMFRNNEEGKAALGGPSPVEGESGQGVG